MDQPPLDHHYVVQHLGGPKHVERRRDGKHVSTAVGNGALTIVPAGTQFKWRTQGPIEFAHLYISPGLLSRAASRLDKGSEVELIDRVGLVDPLLSELYCAMLQEVRVPSLNDALYLDSLLESFMLRLLLGHSNRSLRNPKVRETLSSLRLRRVMDFIEARLDAPMTLSDLAQVSGVSAFHFCRSFKNSTGKSPYQFVLGRRIHRARLLLRTTDWPLAAIAKACGFRGVASFCKTFSRMTGDAPSRSRRR